MYSQTCEQRPHAGNKINKWSLLRGGLCSEVNFYENWPFKDSETWSLLRWSLFGGGPSSRFDCTSFSKLLLLKVNFKRYNL